MGGAFTLQNSQGSGELTSSGGKGPRGSKQQFSFWPMTL